MILDWCLLGGGGCIFLVFCVTWYLPLHQGSWLLNIQLFFFILAFVNAEAADRCDAISCILRNVLDCYHYPRINESLVVTILYLLNHPSTRHYIKHNTDLEVSTEEGITFNKCIFNLLWCLKLVGCSEKILWAKERVDTLPVKCIERIQKDKCVFMNKWSEIETFGVFWWRKIVLGYFITKYNSNKK